MSDVLGLLGVMGVMAGVLVIGFAAPFLTIAVMVWRKRRVRARRRSPIARHLLRSPGHTLRDALETAVTDFAFDLLLLVVLPLFFLSGLLAYGHLTSTERMLHFVPHFGTLTVVFLVATFLKLYRAGPRLDNLKAGYDAELAVGQELDQLMRQGAVVFHDIPAEGFNIDHVVVAAQGVFAVETKGYTKPRTGSGKAGATVVFDGQSLAFPTWTTREPLEQAERQAVWLSRWLGSAVGVPVAVLPVLALPGWFVDCRGRGGVRVFNGRQLSTLLGAHGTRSLPTQLVQQVAHQIDGRCRDVPPRYAETAKAT